MGAVFWRDGWRSFGVGFAVAGWLYFLLAFVNLIGLRQTLITQSALDWMYNQIHASKFPPGMRPVVYESTVAGGQRVVAVRYVASSPAVQPYAPVLPGPVAAPANTYYPAGTITPQPASSVLVHPHSFANIGHALWTLIAGVSSGLVAHLLFMRSRRDTATDTTNQQPPAEPEQVV